MRFFKYLNEVIKELHRDSSVMTMTVDANFFFKGHEIKKHGWRNRIIRFAPSVFFMFY